MKLSRSTIITGLAALVVAAAIPGAMHDTFATGRIYLFSRDFVAELPQRFTGLGRLRFILQPLVAILLGIRDGRADARGGRPPYLAGLYLHGERRREYLKSALASIRDLLAMGIILDAIAQFLIYQLVHPGAALVIGPVLICTPYAAARGLANRIAGLGGGRGPT